MRIVTAFLLLSLAPAALAQPCDPTQTDDACPDTTTWQRYFPLAVGNQWHYEDERFTGDPVTFSSWAITGQTEVDGQAYFEFERCDEAADGSAACADPLLLRYDDEHELIVRRTDDGDVWWDVLPCGLSAPFNTGGDPDESNECTGPATGFTPVLLEGAYGAVVDVPPDEVAGDTRKSFEMYPGTGPEMYAGLGVTRYFYDLVGEPMQLVYAHVGGEQVGTPAFASCNPSEAGSVVCPDTTDWKQYFPLAVGNRWQYERSSFCGVEGFPPCRFGSEIIGTEVVEGMEYFLVRRCTEGLDGEVSCGEAQPIRYDEEQRTVVVRAEEGMTYPYLGLCLALPFGDSVQCSIDGEYEFEWYVSGQYSATFDLGVGPMLVGTTKGFDSLGGGVSYFAGIGRTFSQGDASEISEALTYARIDGVEYGSSAFVFPTTGEPSAAQPTATAFTVVFPNPARGFVQAQYALGTPQAVTLELIDLLGRRIRSEEVGRQAAGTHDVRLDIGGLRAGLYVLRLRGDAGAEATRRVVVL